MKIKRFRGFSNVWSIFVLIFLLSIITGLVWLFWPYFKTGDLMRLIKNRSQISGTLDLNGPIPTGSKLLITQRDIGQTNKQSSQIVISPVDKQNFIIESRPGSSYEIDAQLVQSNGTTTASSPIYVTAPAKSESLRINFTNPNSPIVSTSLATISGRVKVNGYIPSGAYINIEGKRNASKNFVIVVENLKADQVIPMDYDQAIENQTYQIRGKMYDRNGNIIGQSNTIEVVAPAQNEELIINSSAKSPSVNTAITGFITLNGNSPPNSSVVIYWRKSGTGEYTTALDGIAAVDGAKWSIKNATQGVTYEIFAVLKQKELNIIKDVSGSGSQLVSAPATNIFLKINSGFQLPGAVGSISLTCKNHNSASNKWDATISYQSILGAKAYWFEVGTTSTWNDVLNQKALDVGTSYQTAYVNILDSVIYYTRYASNNTGSFEDTSFSPFSGVSNIKCPP